MITIRYIDAIYFTNKYCEYKKLTTHIALGKLVSCDNCIMISFVENNGIPKKGLLVPKEALILKEKILNKNSDILKDLSSYKNSNIGVYWKDVVYFENNIPNECTQMYSEGELFSEDSEIIIIKNPITIKIKNKIDNHPKVKVFFIVIPKLFVTSIEFYDKKL